MRRIRDVANVGVAVVFTLLGTVAAGCGNGAPNSEGQTLDLGDADRGFVGPLDRSDALVAVLVSGGQAVVYVCNGNEDISLWFAGPGESSVIGLTNLAGARVEAAVSGGEVAGTVTFAGGEQHEFLAVPAEPGAGLLRVTGADATADGIDAGWIVANDGETRGSLRVNGTRRTAPAAPGGSVTVDRTDYPVSVFLVDVDKKPAPAGPIPIPYPNIGSAATATR